MSIKNNCLVSTCFHQLYISKTSWIMDLSLRPSFRPSTWYFFFRCFWTQNWIGRTFTGPPQTIHWKEEKRVFSSEISWNQLSHADKITEYPSKFWCLGVDFNRHWLRSTSGYWLSEAPSYSGCAGCKDTNMIQHAAKPGCLFVHSNSQTVRSCQINATPRGGTHS